MEPFFQPLKLGCLDQATSIHGEVMLVPWSRSTLQTTFQEKNTLSVAALENQKLIGFMIGRCLLDEAEVLTLAVSKNWQRKGIAKQLLRAFVCQVKDQGAQKIILEVQEDNNPARSLYQKLGFIKVGSRKGYYPKDGNSSGTAEILEKNLL